MIVDFTVASQDNAGPPPNTNGYEYIPIDLNNGVGGKYIYVGCKRGGGTPVTTIGFGTFNDAQQDNPFPGYEWNANDLNRGAGGQYIYMYWKRGEVGKAPLLNLTFIVTPLSSPPPLAGYQPIHVDLNAGAGGPYIWPYASFSVGVDFAAAAAPKMLAERAAGGKVAGVCPTSAELSQSA